MADWLTELIPGYTLKVLAGRLELLAPHRLEMEPVTDLIRYNTTEPEVFRAGDTVFVIQARRAEPVEPALISTNVGDMPAIDPKRFESRDVR